MHQLLLLINNKAPSFLVLIDRFAEYDVSAVESPSLMSSPLVADIMKRSMLIRWSEKGHSSFRSMRKKFQEATWK